MVIRKPEQRDINGLVRLSKKFANKSEWAQDVPIGKIGNYSEAEKWLFGENIYRCLIAEDRGVLIGYIGVKEYEEGYEASIIVDSKYQGQGVGRKLTNEIFKLIPQEIEVEAWVADFNEKSLTITPKLGFKLKEKFKESNFIPGKEFTVYVFTRKGESK